MQNTWSSQQEWDGFRPTAYSLDSQVPELQITRGPGGSTWAPARTELPAESATTLGEVFMQLREEELQEISLLLVLTVKTASEEHTFSGPSFNLSLLAALLRLQKVGVHGFDASWLYYDSNSLRDDPHDSYVFFVVSGDKIVEERVAFSDYHENGFNPSVFTSDNRPPAIWIYDSERKEALTRYWYRRFYMETRTGQLMVLRLDEPVLYFYPEGRADWELPLAVRSIQISLQKTHLFLVRVSLMVLLLLLLILLWR